MSHPADQTAPTSWETDELLVSFDELEAALAAMRGYYGASDPAAEAVKVFSLLGGGTRQPRVRVTQAILEGIFDYHRWAGMKRCHCGDRAADLFWRLRAALAGEKPALWVSSEEDDMMVRYGLLGD